MIGAGNIELDLNGHTIDGDDNIVTRNEVDDALGFPVDPVGGFGILLDERNRAKGNGDLGIEAIAGVTDGGGNRASANGNPAHCQGVACS